MKKFSRNVSKYYKLEDMATARTMIKELELNKPAPADGTKS
jgi:hypothetical protein